MLLLMIAADLLALDAHSMPRSAAQGDLVDEGVNDWRCSLSNFLL
jgi:hypothetical protein